jgi:hypothetical protein
MAKQLKTAQPLLRPTIRLPHSSITSLAKVKIENKVLAVEWVDENGGAKRKRRTWRHSARGVLTVVSGVDIVVVQEAEDLAEAVDSGDRVVDREAVSGEDGAIQSSRSEIASIPHR